MSQLHTWFGRRGLVLVDAPDRARLRATPVGELSFGPQHAVDRRLRCAVVPRVGEARNDLFRRQIAVLRRVHDREHVRAFGRRQRVGRTRSRPGSAVVAHVRATPALHAPLVDADLHARALAASAGRHGFVHQTEDHFPFPSSVPSSPSPQISRTFFWSTSSAAVSARALSLRRSSRSSSLIRLPSALRPEPFAHAALEPRLQDRRAPLLDFR